MKREGGKDALRIAPNVRAVDAATAPRITPTRADVAKALEQCGGNRAAASRALGIGRTTLWRLLKADDAR